MNQQNLCLPWPRNLSACLRGLHRSWSLLGSLSLRSAMFLLLIILRLFSARWEQLSIVYPPLVGRQNNLNLLHFFFFSFFVQFFFFCSVFVFSDFVICFFFCSPSAITIWDAHMFGINHFYLARSCSFCLASSSSSLFWKFLMTNCCPSIYHYYSYIYLAFARQIFRHANDLDIIKKFWKLLILKNFCAALNITLYLWYCCVGVINALGLLCCILLINFLFFLFQVCNISLFMGFSNTTIIGGKFINWIWKVFALKI